MKTVEKIKQPIYQEMKQFEQSFYRSMKSNVSLLDRIVYFIVNRKGKQMRPMLTLLTAKMMGNGQINDRTYLGASVVELIHTATLVHDDVIDNSQIRRNFYSLNALWKNKIAVLVGDYLLSRGILSCTETKNFDLLDTISTAMKEMAEGELLQLEKSRTFNIQEGDYYQIIRQKTAALLSACCAMGALSVHAKEKDVKLMQAFGINVGMSFQIKDDLFDYGPRKIGKPRGIDIREKKMTLPLIYTISNASKKNKKWLIHAIKNHSKKPKVVKQIIQLVKESGGIQYTIKKMNQYRDEAENILMTYPKNKYRDALELMLHYVIDRRF
ncbi:MAG: polyprenyl synthetase family protein [Flavobacteriaceae bacterium]|nr:polyprenyl synthetase family protein [Flavobacteriaceae bacterium]